MKNYVPIYFGQGEDPANPGVPHFAIGGTAQDTLQSLTDVGYTDNQSVTLYYAPLNKFYLMLAWSYANYLGDALPGALDWTTDRQTALEWNTDNPPAGEWRTDSNDPQWQKNVSIGKERIVESGKTKVGTLKLTVAQILVTALVVLSQTRGNTLIDAARTTIQTILKRLIDGTITNDEALAQYEKALVTYRILG